MTLPYAVLTGPIRGTVTLKDGTEIDIRPDIVYVDTPEQAQEVADAIGARYAKEGHPHHDPGAKFHHDKPKGR